MTDEELRAPFEKFYLVPGPDDDEWYDEGDLLKGLRAVYNAGLDRAAEIVNERMGRFGMELAAAIEAEKGQS